MARAGNCHRTSIGRGRHEEAGVWISDKLDVFASLFTFNKALPRRKTPCHTLLRLSIHLETLSLHTPPLQTSPPHALPPHAIPPYALHSHAMLPRTVPPPIPGKTRRNSESSLQLGFYRAIQPIVLPHRINNDCIEVAKLGAQSTACAYNSLPNNQDVQDEDGRSRETLFPSETEKHGLERQDTLGQISSLHLLPIHSLAFISLSAQ